MFDKFYCIYVFLNLCVHVPVRVECRLIQSTDCLVAHSFTGCSTSNSHILRLPLWEIHLQLTKMLVLFLLYLLVELLLLFYQKRFTPSDSASTQQDVAHSQTSLYSTKEKYHQGCRIPRTHLHLERLLCSTLHLLRCNDMCKRKEEVLNHGH